MKYLNKFREILKRKLQGMKRPYFQQCLISNILKMQNRPLLLIDFVHAGFHLYLSEYYVSIYIFFLSEKKINTEQLGCVINTRRHDLPRVRDDCPVTLLSFSAENTIGVVQKRRRPPPIKAHVLAATPSIIRPTLFFKSSFIFISPNSASRLFGAVPILLLFFFKNPLRGRIRRTVNGVALPIIRHRGGGLCENNCSKKFNFSSRRDSSNV